MPSAVGYQPTLATEMGQLQERITSTKKGSVTSIQAIYVPADDYTDPAPATAFAHLDATTNLERRLTQMGIYPAVDPLASSSRALTPEIVGEEHYEVAMEVQRVLQRYKELQDIIAILGMDELSDDEKKFSLDVHVVSNSSFHKTSTLRNNLLVNLVHMYQLTKLSMTSKKFWKVNMTKSLKMLSVV